MGSTYPGQRPQCPSLSPHFLWTNSINISNTLEFSIFGLIKKKHPHRSDYNDTCNILGHDNLIVTCVCCCLLRFYRFYYEIDTISLLIPSTHFSNCFSLSSKFRWYICLKGGSISIFAACNVYRRPFLLHFNDQQICLRFYFKGVTLYN